MLIILVMLLMNYTLMQMGMVLLVVKMLMKNVLKLKMMMTMMKKEKMDMRIMKEKKNLKQSTCFHFHIASLLLVLSSC